MSEKPGPPPVGEAIAQRSVGGVERHAKTQGLHRQGPRTAEGHVPSGKDSLVSPERLPTRRTAFPQTASDGPVRLRFLLRVGALGGRGRQLGPLGGGPTGT